MEQCEHEKLEVTEVYAVAKVRTMVIHAGDASVAHGAVVGAFGFDEATLKAIVDAAAIGSCSHASDSCHNGQPFSNSFHLKTVFLDESPFFGSEVVLWRNIERLREVGGGVRPQHEGELAERERGENDEAGRVIFGDNLQ